MNIIEDWYATFWQSEVASHITNRTMPYLTSLSPLAKYFKILFRKNDYESGSHEEMRELLKYKCYFIYNH